MLFDMWKYVYFESACNTLYTEIKQMLNKIFFGENKR